MSGGQANQKAVYGREGRTTVMVTHKVLVVRMCDRVVVLAEGQMRDQGTYEELFMCLRVIFFEISFGVSFSDSLFVH